MSKFYFKINRIDIPLVTTGTSPFIGAGQFGFRGLSWREKFLYNPQAMVEILEASYQAGAKGIEAVPLGKIIEAARIMMETHDDYVITGSTYPGKDPGIEALISMGAKLIFVHGMISDKKGKKLLKLLDDIHSRGVIPGIATHDPIPTIKYTITERLNVKAFLIPFNATGEFMADVEYLEKIVDNTSNYFFIGMKTLAAGTIDPKIAFEYISKHNIHGVTIGMVNIQEAQTSTKIAVEFLNKK
jgi:hypothetical protein